MTTVVSQARLAMRGSFEAVPAGQRLRLDPRLQNAQGAKLAPTWATASSGFLVVSIQDTPGPDFGTFDVQNISTLPQDLLYFAEWTHTIQKSNTQPDQTDLGPLGAQPSPLPPLPLGGGGGGGDVEFFSFPVSFAAPGVIPLTPLAPGDIVVSSEIHITTPFDDPLASLALGDGVAPTRFLSVPAPNALLSGIWYEGNTDVIAAPAVLTLTQVSAGTQGSGLLLVRIKRA